MPNIRMPDGTVVRFPDDMPREQINGMIAQKFPDVASGQAPDEAGSAMGLAKSYGSGLARGTLALGSLASKLIPGMPQWSQPSAETVQKGLEENITGEWHKPQGFGEELAYKGGEFTPGIVGGPGSLATRAATQVAAPALGSQLGGIAGEQFGPGGKPVGELVGGLAGGITGQTAQSLVRKAVTPNAGVSAERLAAVKTLEDEGVDAISAGQATGNKSLLTKEAQNAGQAFTAQIEKQQRQLSAAAFAKAGLKADRATPEVIDDYLNDIGSQFDELAATSKATITRNDSIRAMQIADRYATNTEGTAAKNVAKIAESFKTDGRKELTGETYQALRTEIQLAAKSAGSPNQKNALDDLRNLLDDTVERGIASDAKNVWSETRRHYKNWKALEKAIDPTTGLVSPASLQRAAVSGAGKSGYLRGRSDFTKLGNAADLVMEQPKSSGTAENIRAQLSKYGAKSAAGYAGGHLLGGPIGGLVGAVGVPAFGAVSDRLLMSAPYQKYLRNQLLRRPDKKLPLWPGLAASQFMEGE